MGTSEVHLPEGENLIDFSQRGASLLLSFFFYVLSAKPLSVLDGLAAAAR